MCALLSPPPISAATPLISCHPQQQPTTALVQATRATNLQLLALPHHSPPRPVLPTRHLPAVLQPHGVPGGARHQDGAHAAGRAAGGAAGQRPAGAHPPAHRCVRACVVGGGRGRAMAAGKGMHNASVPSSGNTQHNAHLW
jgi:hypothetical protein